jgi:hypothetical protein
MYLQTAPKFAEGDGQMKPRHLAVVVVIMLWATMAGSPAAADNTDGDDKSRYEPQSPLSRFGGPSMSWDEAIRQGDRQLTETQGEEAVKQTGQDSSPQHYYPDLPDDPRENPSLRDDPGNGTANDSRGK